MPCTDGWGASHVGNQKSSASFSVDCFAGVFAEVYAKAVANAAIAGKCGHWKRARVNATTKAKVGAKIKAAEICDVAQSNSGLSKSKGFGGTFARSRCGSPSCSIMYSWQRCSVDKLELLSHRAAQACLTGSMCAAERCREFLRGQRKIRYSGLTCLNIVALSSAQQVPGC